MKGILTANTQRAQRKTRTPDLSGVLIVFCVFAVKILGFGVFQGRLIKDEGMSKTVADASGSERYVGKSEHCAG